MLRDTAAGAFARSRWSDGRFTGAVDYRARMCAGGGERGRVGDRGREGNDRVIEEGRDGDQLQTTERPSCVLDYISMNDSHHLRRKPKRMISRRISANIEVTLLSRAPFFEGPRFFRPHFLVFALVPHRWRTYGTVRSWILLSNASSIHFISHSRFTYRWRRHFTSLEHCYWSLCFVLCVHSIVLDCTHLFLGLIKLVPNILFRIVQYRAPASVTHLFTAMTTMIYRRIQSLEDFTNRSFNGIFKFNALKEMYCFENVHFVSEKRM